MLAQSKRRKSFLSIKSTTMGHLGAKGNGRTRPFASEKKKGLWVHLSVLVHFYFFLYFILLSQNANSQHKQSICDNTGQLCHRRESDRTHTHAHFTQKCSLFCRKIMTTTTRKEEENKEEERRRRRRKR